MKRLVYGALIAAMGCSNNADPSEGDDGPISLTIGTGALQVATGARVSLQVNGVTSITGMTITSSDDSVVDIVAFDDDGGPILAHGRKRGTSIVRLEDGGVERAAGQIEVADPAFALLPSEDGRPGTAASLSSDATVRRALDSVFHLAIELRGGDNRALQGQLALRMEGSADAVLAPNSGAGELILTPTTAGEHVIVLRLGDRILTTLHDVGVSETDVVSAGITASETGVHPGTPLCISADSRTFFQEPVVGVVWPWRADNVALGAGDSVCYTYAPDARATLLTLDAPGAKSVAIHGTALRVRAPGER